MSDSGNVPELQDLEPLDPGTAAPEVAAAPPAAAPDAVAAALRAGLPPPAFNPRCTDKAYYRFLFCGVLIVLGCLMPFGADRGMAGYQTMGGAVFLVIGLGMVWTWWGAIHFNRSSGKSLKWILLCFLPFGAQVMNLMAYDPEAALTAAKQAGYLPAVVVEVSTWSTLFADIGTALGKSVDAAPAALRVENFFRCFGTGKIFVLLGAALAEVVFVLGVVGGAKQNKQQQVARMAQASERRRR